MNERIETPVSTGGHVTDDAPVTAPPTNRALWIGGLEGPRGFGAICIIVAHVAVVHAPAMVAKTHLEFIGQALTFFFALSGFLLYLPYVKRLVDGKSAPDTKKYFISRVRRVFPAYIVIFLIVNFVFQAAYVTNPIVGGWQDYDATTGIITQPLHLLANLTLTQSLFPSTLQTGINPAWSLTTEWGFYLTLPLLGYLLFRLCRNTKRPLVAAMVPALGLVVLGLAVSVLVAFGQSRTTGTPLPELYWGPHWIAVASRSFFAIADNFAWGMVAAVVYVAISKGAFGKYSTTALKRILAAVMGLFVLLSMVAFVFGSHYYPSFFAVASGALILLIIAPFARGENSRLATITDWAPMKFLGTLSLSAYLWHYPVLIMVGRLGFPFEPTFVGIAGGAAVVIVVTFTLACATYYLVERPAMRWRA